MPALERKQASLHQIPRHSGYKELDEATFNEALAKRDAGEIAEAMKMLEKLAMKLPNSTPVIGMLAGVQYEAGEYER